MAKIVTALAARVHWPPLTWVISQAKAQLRSSLVHAYLRDVE